VSYSLWRVFDGDGDGGPPVEGCDPDNPDPGRVFGVTFYTGDGTGPRNITVDLDGRLPLLGIVVPHDGAAFVRDPSHTGTQSTNWSSGAIDAANAIRGGGIDFITVGNNLNQLGIVYDVFVIVGEMGNGGTGWSPNPQGGVIVPVPPQNPCNPPGPPPEPPEPPPGPGNACTTGGFPTELT
jgi:hypothetical protein